MYFIKIIKPFYLFRVCNSFKIRFNSFINIFLKCINISNSVSKTNIHINNNTIILLFNFYNKFSYYNSFSHLLINNSFIYFWINNKKKIYNNTFLICKYNKISFFINKKRYYSKLYNNIKNNKHKSYLNINTRRNYSKKSNCFKDLKKTTYFFFSKGNRSSLYLYLNIFIFILIFLVFLISGCTLTDVISFCTNLLGKTEIEISNSTSTSSELETSTSTSSELETSTSTSSELETTNSTSSELETTNSWGFWSWAAVAVVAGALAIVTLMIYKNTPSIDSILTIANDPSYSTWDKPVVSTPEMHTSETPLTMIYATEWDSNQSDVVVEEFNRIYDQNDVEEFNRIYDQNDVDEFNTIYDQNYLDEFNIIIKEEIQETNLD